MSPDLCVGDRAGMRSNAIIWKRPHIVHTLEQRAAQMVRASTTRLGTDVYTAAATCRMRWETDRRRRRPAERLGRRQEETEMSDNPGGTKNHTTRALIELRRR